jgi:hypothetical protein
MFIAPLEDNLMKVKSFVFETPDVAVSVPSYATNVI